MTCKLCHSHQISFKFFLEEKYGIYSCSDCKVEFMDPQLSDSEILSLYSENYYSSWGVSGEHENESSKQMKIATFLLRLKLIQSFVPKGKVLDIGCATGFFLEAAQANGYDPYGIEISEYSSAFAKKKFGSTNVFNGKLEDCAFEQGFFDVISMFDLIEHVRVPSETIALSKKLLSPNGIIIITTPNNSSISNKFMRKKWTHYKKEHFYYLNHSSLEYIALQNNMEIIHSERSNKALNIDYLHTQFNVYKHWLFTPVINIVFRLLPKKISKMNFYISIGEITVILKNKN